MKPDPDLHNAYSDRESITSDDDNNSYLCQIVKVLAVTYLVTATSLFFQHSSW